MADIYLSPSTQEFNQYVTGGNEEYYTNLIADAMVPYLRASDIDFDRNNPGAGVMDSIKDSNDEEPDFHLAIHTNAAPERMAGMIQGPNVYYFAGSSRSRAAAEIFANNLKLIYPQPDLVKAIPTTELVELRRTKAPAVLVEVAYHDNVDDANWITSNIETIAENLALSTADVLGVPFVEP